MNRRGFITKGAGLLAAAAWHPQQILAAGPVPAPAATFTVDARVELFNVILYLSAFRGFAGNTPLTRLSFPYVEQVDAHFGAFREHDAIRHYEAMAERGFWLTHPPSVMLHLSGPPLLVEEVPINDFTVRMAGGRRPLEAFLAEVRRFAAQTGFMDWFRGQSFFHQQLASRYADRMEWNYVQDLTDYYGDRRESYTLILAPLSHPGGFGPRVQRPDGRHDAYAVIGPRAVAGEFPDFGSGQSMRYLFWHEFSHSHVNHLTDLHLERLTGPVTVLDGRRREEVEEYVPWEIHVSDWVSEHVVRAVTTRLTYRKIGPDAGEAALRREVAQFPHVAEVCERLKEYEEARIRYPRLEMFYPRLVDVFETVAASR